MSRALATLAGAYVGRRVILADPPGCAPDPDEIRVPWTITRVTRHGFTVRCGDWTLTDVLHRDIAEWID